MYVNLHSSEPKANYWDNLKLRLFSFNEKCVSKDLAHPILKSKEISSAFAVLATTEAGQLKTTCWISG